ncbi:ejaculatory bulb-specific protein 3-like [Homalodisca vitripennis]|uniref:ejaculatory bulb-specific protein 3-like n=1 Tax=Homalodisca vitripennis TaxID=197043 RepID=UPI001EEB203A|nr:ejaculatory bulb-specific protein 3-like [Homalodisca vitripennis]
MYAVVVLTGLMVVAVTGETYTTKFDNVDLENILKNDRLFLNYFNCIMDKGKCSPDGEELKKHIPEALENACAKCSEKQKQGGEKVLKYMYEKKPDLFRQLEEKFDPEGKYRVKYRKLAQERGYKV